MKTVLITGASGFLGRNLIATLALRSDVRILTYDISNSLEELAIFVSQADFVFHLAGVNRPRDTSEFEAGNAGLTQQLVDLLQGAAKAVPVLLASSTQAQMENAYGLSKLHGEMILRDYGVHSGVNVFIFRLPNVFGKWSKPHYNSVVATFCHNVAHGIPLEIHDRVRTLDLVYVDDVVEEFVKAMDGAIVSSPGNFSALPRIFQTTVGQLADTISRFPSTRETHETPPVGDDLSRRLYSMYLSYLPEDKFAYALDVKQDQRGWLAEVIRSQETGQIFVSGTKPGITRGNHWHHTKTEKFLVVHGEAVIRLRHVSGGEVIDYPVSGSEAKVVDIPPGYTHSITNVGTAELVTLFWANEPFDPQRPDTFSLPVLAPS